MNDKSMLNELLGQFNSESFSLQDFILNIMMTIVLTLVLGLVYKKYGKSLSNRQRTSEIFVLLSLTTMIIITIVKSSIALSLGLVGALSIVRFRTAIKEPEELVYFFIAIAIGLGLGANQRAVVVLGVVVAMLFIVLRNLGTKSLDSQQNLVITLFSDRKDIKIDEDAVFKLIKSNGNAVELKRFDSGDGMTELSCNATFNSLQDILRLKDELSKLDKEIKISFVQNH
tara:strand:- start:18638 stop:19321 length:684 start_codon:yes stop_codon:yes gene_type:complete